MVGNTLSCSSDLTTEKHIDSELPKVVAVVGCGLIGSSWAALFAAYGLKVRVWDADPSNYESSLHRVKQALAQISRGRHRFSIDAASERISYFSTLEEALAEVEYVQEAVSDRIDVKLQIFERLDKLCDLHTVLASSTSSAPASEFASNLKGRARCLVAHPANPPHLLPIVEIVPATFTAEGTMVRTQRLMRSLEQNPVILKKEVVGFVMNRLQTALVNEAISLVDEDVIDPDGLDLIVSHSLGRRWAFMGPFETMDLNAAAGFLDYALKYKVNYERRGALLNVGKKWSDDTLRRIEASRRKIVPTNELVSRQLWRDENLVALLSLEPASEDISR
ncbi:3-hydroxyacyl-CoA dehydrogenase [Mesorhizobium sp.]|uniref:3-hydroxyacyl-CoA dehydrogenase n=1 Tax=Mesorhizobium sp. TaxID=1871066 RepID=UPI000FE5E1DD|nr:3-hydroxyacyl-CoA dehydrogenase [Mesorhizobium sp.]RWD41516.1 MAG: 3-hydroxyacyl-CoA dehydrogenase [Mesorhizobium sp.]